MNFKPVDLPVKTVKQPSASVKPDNQPSNKVIETGVKFAEIGYPFDSSTDIHWVN
jgi:hypothetical protein